MCENNLLLYNNYNNNNNNNIYNDNNKNNKNNQSNNIEWTILLVGRIFYTQNSVSQIVFSR